MYQVTCPSCHAVVSTPFVRVGAVLSCGSCHHRYLIDAGHIRQVAGPDGAGKRSDQPSGANAPMQGGMHGLRELMRREAELERDSRFDDYETIAPEPDRPMAPAIIPSSVTPVPIAPERGVPDADPRPASGAPGAEADKPAKSISMGFVIVLASAIVLACFGGGIWYYLQPRPPAAMPVNPDEAEDAGPVYDGPIFQGLPLVESIALEHTAWEQPNTPFIPTAQQYDDVYLADQRLEPGDAGEIAFVCDVVSDRPSVILHGELTISLVNPQGIEKAITTVPLTLISPGHPMSLRIPIPANLDPTMMTPAWSITVDQWAESGELIDDCSVQTQSAGADTMARLLVGNDTDHEVHEVTMLVTALGDEDKVLRRWRVVWELPLKPKGYVELYTRTAVNPSWDIRKWTVSAAAE